ncbi:MAG: DUF3137 domain-containing protein [Gammaproteobacteria bacterium]|nr:MAG: DUF3137 domain-containing protein [Gammaproteobacteria bacterium]
MDLQKSKQLYPFYQKELVPEIELLEQDRKKIVKKMTIVGVVLVALVIPCFFIFEEIDSMIFPVVIAAVIFAGLLHYFSKDYACEFKENVLRKIVEYIDPNLVYTPTFCISEGQFQSSGIFRKGIDRYKGDDHVEGTIGATKIEFSEIHAEYVTRDSKGRTSNHTIFKGLFFIGDFNKHFKTDTYVLPDQAERFLGSIGGMLQGINKQYGELIKMEDPVFEKEFVVYGEDQIEARYILSPALMERITKFRKKSGQRISLSFKGSKVYIAIPFSKNLFEPSIFSTILDFKPVKEFFDDFALMIDIVEDLNLNTRIWTKK